MLCEKHKNITMYQSVVKLNFSHVLRVSAEHTESDYLKDNLNRFFEIENLGVKENK